MKGAAIETNTHDEMVRRRTLPPVKQRGLEKLTSMIISCLRNAIPDIFKMTMLVQIRMDTNSCLHAYAHLSSYMCPSGALHLGERGMNTSSATTGPVMSLFVSSPKATIELQAVKGLK